MAYDRPTLATLIARAIGDISARSRGSAFIKVSVERVLAYVLAGLTHGLHGHLEWLYQQISPVTCELAGLLAWGVIIRTPRKSATQATRYATFTGTNTTELPLDTALQDAGGGAWTVITGGVVGTPVSGSVTVEIEADEAGTDGNLDEGAEISLVSPIAGIDTDGEIAATEGVDGVDLEDTEDYRVRILNSLRTPPSGGGPGDYETWALEVAGVTRAWEFGNRMGVGTVSLAFVRDDDVDIIPSGAEVTEVQTYIEARMPLDMRALYVQAPVEVPVTMTIALAIEGGAVLATVKAAILAALVELFRNEADLETEMVQSVIDEAISTAAGEVGHEITVISSLDPGDFGLLTFDPDTAVTWASL